MQKQNLSIINKIKINDLKNLKILHVTNFNESIMEDYFITLEEN